MKRLFAILLVTIMLTGLVACGEGTDKATTTNPSTSSSNVSSTTTLPSSSSTQPSSSATQSTTSTHVHNYVASITKQPDCENPGVKSHKCNCGDSYTEPIDATGHSWGSWSQTKNPTDKIVGKKQRSCSKCRGTEYADVPVLSKEEYLLSYSEEMLTVFAFNIYPLEFESIDQLPAGCIRESIYQKLRWDGKYTEYEKVFDGDDYPTFMHVYKLADLQEQTRIYFGIDIDWTSLNNTSDRYEYEVYDPQTQQVTRAFPGGAGGGPSFQAKDVYDCGDGTYDIFIDIWDYDYETGTESVTGGMSLVVRETEYGYAAVSIHKYE